MNIVIDMGGTNTRVAFSDNNRDFYKIERFPTPKSQDEMHKKISEIIGGSTDKIEKILLGVAGLVDYKNKVAINAPYIRWINHMTASDLTGIDGHDIKLFNDAELSGIAEAHQPYSTKYENVAYITISTGVGGTIIRNKKAATHCFNYEPGHIVIDKSTQDTDPSDNIVGSFESLCSGTGFYKKYNVQPENCSDLEIWRKYGIDLADGLYTLTLLWQPEAIVLGGSMTKQWNSFHASMMQRYTSYPPYYKLPEIIKSNLDDMNGLLGGLKLLSQ